MIIMKTRQDMDAVVNARGIPLKVIESFVGGMRPMHYVNLYYGDGIYMFQTDTEKSYTLFLRSHVANFENLSQGPIPMWFKLRFPDFRWAGIPTAA
jgi:hypothetical protein